MEELPVALEEQRYEPPRARDREERYILTGARIPRLACPVSEMQINAIEHKKAKKKLPTSFVPRQQRRGFGRTDPPDQNHRFENLVDQASL